MKIRIYKKNFMLKSFYFKEIELECKGAGTEEDPAIIDPSIASLPKDFYIRNNSYYIHIINCKNHLVSLKNCMNITIEDCNVEICILDKCLNIKIINNTITNSLKLYYCRDIIIERSNIRKLSMYYSRSNIFKICTIDHIVYKFSRNNVYEANTIPEKQLLKLNKSSLLEFVEKWGFEYTVPLMVIFIPIALLLDYLFNLFPILTTVVIIFLSIFFIISASSHYQYNKTVEKEEIIS